MEKRSESEIFQLPWWRYSNRSSEKLCQKLKGTTCAKIWKEVQQTNQNQRFPILGTCRMNEQLCTRANTVRIIIKKIYFILFQFFFFFNMFCLLWTLELWNRLPYGNTRHLYDKILNFVGINYYGFGGGVVQLNYFSTPAQTIVKLLFNMCCEFFIFIL